MQKSENVLETVITVSQSEAIPFGSRKREYDEDEQFPQQGILLLTN